MKKAKVQFINAINNGDTSVIEQMQLENKVPYTKPENQIDYIRMATEKGNLAIFKKVIECFPNSLSHPGVYEDQWYVELNDKGKERGYATFLGMGAVVFGEKTTDTIPYDCTAGNSLQHKSCLAVAAKNGHSEIFNELMQLIPENVKEKLARSTDVDILNRLAESSSSNSFRSS